MNIINLKIKDLKPYEKNAKKHDKTQINNVAESIKQFGMVQPIVVDKDNIVIIGHCRLEACKKLKFKEVPCVKAEDLDEEQVAKLRLLDNKLNESEWDFDLLSEELFDLDMSGFELDWGIVQDDGFGTDFELPSGDKGNIQQITFTLSNMQAELVKKLINQIQDTKEFKIYNESESDNANKNGNALYMLLSKVNLEG